MQKTELVGFRASPDERQKLEALATGERCTISEVLRRLVQHAPVIEVQLTGLTFSTQNKSAVSAYQGNNGAFAN